jgi:hypothetical protein
LRLPADTVNAIAARLQELRLAFGYTSFMEWSRFTGATNTSWHNYEAGQRVIFLTEALKLCTKTGVSLDWIYRGLDHTLPMNVAERLSKFRETGRKVTLGD